MLIVVGWTEIDSVLVDCLVDVAELTTYSLMRNYQENPSKQSKFKIGFITYNMDNVVVVVEQPVLLVDIAIVDERMVVVNAVLLKESIPLFKQIKVPFP